MSDRPSDEHRRSKGLRFYAHATGVSTAELAVVTTITLVAVGLDAFSTALLLPLLHLVERGASGLGTAELPRAVVLLVTAIDRMGLRVSVLTLLATVLALNILRSAVTYLRMRYRAYLKARAEVSHRARLFDGILHARLDFVEGRGQGALVNSLIFEAQGTGNLIFSLTAMLGHGIMLVLFALLAVVISVPLAAIALVTLALLYVTNRAQLRASQTLGEQIARRNERFSTHLLDRLGDLRSVKINATERIERDELVRVADAVGAAEQERHAVQGLSQAKIEMISVAALVGVMAMTALPGAVTLPSIMVVGLLLIRMVPVSTQFVNALQNVHAYASGFRNVIRILEQLAEHREPEGGPGIFRGVREEITVDGVSFRYGPDAQSVLHGVSASLVAGRLNVIAGPSGAGKSTLLDVLMGLREPTEGRILIDGAPLDAFTRRSFRAKASYLPQKGALFRGTLRDNVVCGGLDVEAERVAEALTASQASDFVNGRTKGLDTLVGDGFEGLSVGQMQRILLARALVRRPDVLFLDEPTAALDADTARKLIETLQDLARRRCTVVAASHDPLLIAAADHVIRLDHAVPMTTA